MSKHWRVHRWINVGSMDDAWSVQHRIAPRKWLNVTDNGQALFFKSKEKAKAFMAECQSAEDRE